MKIGLYTVPHTGTHFAMQYFNLLGLKSEAFVTSSEKYIHRHAGYKNHDWEEFSKLKCIVMARDPYLSGIRFLRDNKTVEDCARHWNEFLDSYNELDHFILDLGIVSAKREKHLCQVAEFIGKCPNEYQQQIGEYANNWTPVNSRNTEMKTRYIESGILPTNHNWKILDRAVAWYKSLETNDY